MTDVQVVLQHVNDYSQHGGYFVGVFDTVEEAFKHFDHFGRLGNEHTWYTIHSIVTNWKYDLDLAMHRFPESEAQPTPTHSGEE